jgi:pimeloyl-ACP methyl ester carboxylesterase
MRQLIRDGVRLAYEEKGAGSKSVIFVHGLGFDHTTFAPQIEYSRSHRVVAIDLRGHGASDAPHQDYTMPTLAEDVAWLSAKLNLEKPVIVGHSMGGNVALTLAALYPDLPTSIMLIDSLLFPSPQMREMLMRLCEAFRGPNFNEARAQVQPLFFLPTDDPAIRADLTAIFLTAPQHVLLSGVVQHTILYDAASFTTACTVPVAYIGAASPLADVDALRSAIPNITIAQTLRVGALLTCHGTRPNQRHDR